MEHIEVVDEHRCLDLAALELGEHAQLEPWVFEHYDIRVEVVAEEDDGYRADLAMACDRRSAWCKRKQADQVQGFAVNRSECGTAHDVVLVKVQSLLPETEPGLVDTEVSAFVSAGPGPLAGRAALGVGILSDEDAPLRLTAGGRTWVGLPVLIETSVSQACSPADACTYLQPILSAGVQGWVGGRWTATDLVRADLRALVGPTLSWGPGFPEGGSAVLPQLDLEAVLGLGSGSVTWEVGAQVEPFPLRLRSATDRASVTLPTVRGVLALTAVL